MYYNDDSVVTSI